MAVHDTEKPDLSILQIDRPGKQTGSPRTLGWKIAFPFILIVVLAAGFFLLRSRLATGAEVETVNAAFTNPSQVNAVLTASGYVVAQQKAAVASKGTGRLVYLGVEEGDRVRKGQVIARLEDEDVVAALAKSRADYEVAKADLYDARQTLDRQKTLYASSLTSKADLDAAEARFLRVEATIRSTEAALKGAEVALENTRIRAPFDGTVLTKDANVGEVVAPFASSANSRGAVVTVADMTSLQVEADVSESNITRVSIGQPCEIILDAYADKRYRGTVHKIVPTADRAKATVLTKVAFIDRDERVLPEMSAKVTFLSPGTQGTVLGAPPVVTIPATCLTSRRGTPVVFVVRDGIAQETPVTTGQPFGSSVEIKEGLSQGDRVILSPDPSLTGGTRVNVKSK